MNTNIHHFESTFTRIVQSVSKQFNIKIVIKGDRAYTDGNSYIVLPYIHEVSNELRKKLYGYLYHETGHVKETDFSAYYKRESLLRKYPVIKKWENAIEDIRIEKLMMQNYAGTRTYISFIREYFNTHHLEQLNEMPYNARMRFASQLYIQNYDLSTLKLDEDFYSDFKVLMPLLDTFNEKKSTEEILDLSIELFYTLVKHLEDKELSLSNEIKDINKTLNNGQVVENERIK